jgi:hypothetical protein
LTAPYNPKQNGAAERENRMVMELVRSMMQSRNVVPKFWAEATHTAIYVLNRTLSRTLQRTPFESWFHRKPSLSHLRIFSCPAYIYAEKHTRTKLDSKSRPGIFMGYAKESKAYRIWDTTKNKIVISRDVIFHESSIPSSSSSSSVTTPPSPVTINFSRILAIMTALPIQPSPVANFFPPTVSPSLPSSFPHQNSSPTIPSEPLAYPVLLTPSSPASLSDSNSPDSLNPATCTRFLSDLLNPVPNPIEHDPQDRLNLQLHPPVRSTRVPKLPSRYGDWAYFSTIVDETIIEPHTMIEALSSSHKDQWILAMQAEFQSLLENDTWELVPLPPTRHAISCKWTYQLKYYSAGHIDRYKAQLVARGFIQRYDIDYTKTFSPVAKFDSILTLLSIVVVEDLDLTQSDFRTAFLHGTLDEELYMIQPSYFEDAVHPNYICRLQKSIYDLHQASRVWNKRFTSFLAKYNLIATHQDPCVYRSATAPLILLAIFVDDGLIASTSRTHTDPILQEMNDVFHIRIDEPDTFVGLHITRNRISRSIFLDQTRYVERLLAKYGYSDIHPVQIPTDSTARLSLHMDQGCLWGGPPAWATRPPDTPDRPLRLPDKGQTGID